MSEKYVTVTVEYGMIDYDDDGNGIVFNDQSESFDVSDPSAPYADLFDDLAFEVRNSLDT